MSERVRAGYRGTGPGAITPDGCAVELYERLPVGDEPDVIARAVPARARILELGSGVGRVTHPLVERGFTVTAVDESPRMLERVRGARTVCTPIEDLELDERFDVVLLASFLIHAGDPLVRRGLLRACRQHVTDDGCVLIQRESEDRHENLPRERKIAGGRIRVVSSEPVRPGVRSVHVEYLFPDVRWTQTFLSHPLTTQAFEEALAEAGLAVDAYLTGDRTWVRALPVPGPSRAAPLPRAGKRAAGADAATS
ncbi:3-demethylubiquinone-9 3-O-methyltransferase [Streptomyces netropsis]|uniref:SAM-dependent methyltransferase n=1 Tax=Streptomyces syringium TaxID=76729 RepID=A0ABS4YE43_9ACTN|nr:methyltransferase domain-containing protein [Streptomyces syringium]MBP2406790.1 SAM-dependent methyltransferase [Streptomyces syringium]SPE61910.1 3-demethylubiquinone-9 3-O-methyltransferase [Streptomyces netropsis]